MQPSIGFSLQNHYSLPVAEVIPLLRKAGFAAVSPVWTKDLDLSAIAAATTEQGMTIQSLHSPAGNTAHLWSSDPALYADLLDSILQSIDACSRLGIPILVQHGWYGFDYSFCQERLYFDNFDRIVDYAATRGVSIAFENLEGEEFLAALMTRYRGNANVGYCWDSGHDHCYPHKLDFLAEFGDRLMMTHLNDNLGLRDPLGRPTGDDDLHYLPYDGNLNWDQAIHRLQKAKKLDILNFEFKILSHSKNPKDQIYTHLPLQQYLELAGKRARQIAEKYTHTHETT